jgi:hypothetical protein
MLERESCDEGKLFAGLTIAIMGFYSAAQNSGAPPAIFKPGPEILAELDEAARNSPQPPACRSQSRREYRFGAE